MRVTALTLWLVAFAMPIAVAGSARISVPVSQGLVVEAEFWPGEAGKPTVLVLHGFLVTRDFSAVRRLAESLADEGFNVLTPTLSIGLNRRRQSVACEANHTHSMAQDVAELKAWTDWLAEHAGKPPVLIGHSTGGVQVAALLDAHTDLPVSQAILISLSHFGEEQGVDELEFMLARAREEARSRPSAMLPHSLSYCKSYVTTPASLWSYLAWDKARLKQALTRSKVPVTVIYGGRDEHIDRPWIEDLHAGDIAVRPVPGANHFFDLSHEFNLPDEVLRTLPGGDHG